jgi:hypothetical protein
MVEISIRGDAVTFGIRGWSKVWSLRTRVTVPLASVRAVRRAEPGVTRGWRMGWNMPGTCLPGVIVAGTFYRGGRRIFYDVRGAGERAIVVDLNGAAYDHLVVDVPDREAALQRLEAALRGRTE